MKVSLTDYGISVFVNSSFFKDIAWDKKSDVELSLKELLHKIDKYFKLRLKGFYKIKIYPSKVGVFMKIISLDDEIYDYEDIDFRVIIIRNKDMYFKYDDYYLFSSEHVIYYNDNYYLNIKYLDDYLRYADMGSVVFDDEIDFNKCIFLKKRGFC